MSPLNIAVGSRALLTLDNWFYAPNGQQYRAVFGTVKAVRSSEETLGVKTNAKSSNWYVEIGCLTVAGCQIHYAVATETCELGAVADWAQHEGKTHTFTRPSSVFNADAVRAEAVASPQRPLDVLTWSPTLDCGRVDHADALKAVAKLNKAAFQGHTDWRLPEIRELLSLVDYTRVDPAIDVERFPETKSAYYWTNTSYAGVSGAAWIVSFGYGYAYWYYHGNVAFVRAVRGPSARASQ